MGLPKNWVETKLDIVANIQSGGTPSRSNSKYWNGKIPWVKISDINDFYVDRTEEFITEDGLKNSSTRIFPKGTILFTIFATIGKIGVLKIDAATNQAIAGITPVNLINDKFLTYSLIELANSVSSQGKGVAQKNINQTILKNTPIALPPLPEQDRIVAKLDALFGQLDVMKQSLERIPQLLANFKQQVLTQAVTGKLTEAWREGKELGKLEKLFYEIDKGRSKSKSKKIRENKIEIRNDLELNNLPKQWKWVNLFYFVDDNDAFRYGVVQPGNDVEGEQKLIRVKDLLNGQVLVDGLRGISFNIDSKYKSARVKKGDLLVSIVGTIGRTAIIQDPCQGFNIARALAKVPLKNINGIYVKYFIDSLQGQNWLVGDAREVARKTLNLEQLKTLPIPVPPIEEQQEIVNRVESLFAKADAIEAQYQSLKAKIDSLPQAILHKAFKGELVPQLPTDGDARELLEEIEGLKVEINTKEKSNRRKKVVK